MLVQAVHGARGTVYDLDTGKRVPKVIELNLETGYVRAYFVVEQNDANPSRESIRRNLSGEFEWYEAYGKFKFVPDPRSSIVPENHAKSSPCVMMGAPKCACCSNSLTLPGDDLCPRCRARDRGQRNLFLVERLPTPLLDCKCNHCSRLAVWAVADEVEVTPAVSNKYLWERGMTVGRRYYCDSHYKPARLLDAQGEVITDFNYAGPDILQKKVCNGDE